MCHIAAMYCAGNKLCVILQLCTVQAISYVSYCSYVYPTMDQLAEMLLPVMHYYG